MVFEHIYQYLLNSEGEVELNIGYAKDTFEGIISNISDINQLISKYSIGFELSRVYKVDLAILMLATYEIMYTSIPHQVAINEALELSKLYSTPKSSKYINGVLASITKTKLETD
jgi:N utilization substance protein B